MTIRSTSHVLNSVIYRSVCVCGHAESMYHTYIMCIYILCVCGSVCLWGNCVYLSTSFANSMRIFRETHLYEASLVASYEDSVIRCQTSIDVALPASIKES